MAKHEVKSARRPSGRPTREDYERVLGQLDDPMVLAILEVDPTFEELEEAAICLAGDHDILAKSGHHVSPKAGRVVEIIASTEDRDDARTR